MGELRSVLVNFWLWKPIGHHGPGFSLPLGRVTGGSLWYRTAPVAIADASTSSSDCFVVSGRMSTGAVVTAFFSSHTALQHLSVHSNGMSLPVRRVRGAAINEKRGMCILWYPQTPSMVHTCFTVVSSSGQSAIPAIFAGSILTPSLLMRTPKKSI